MTMPQLEHAISIRPYLGETESGDTALVQPIAGGLFLAIVDVLGHGSDAAQLANAIEVWLLENADMDLVAVMEKLHARLKGTRGAAVGLAYINSETGMLYYLGTGNTVMRKFSDGTDSRFLSREGVLGQAMATPKPQQGILVPHDVLLMYTDGVRSFFSINDYPRFFTDPIRKIARTIVDRFGKDHDDAGCLALRYER